MGRAMSTFTTTVEGSTFAEIEEAADAEVSRFFVGYSLRDPEAGRGREMVLDISPHIWRDGSVVAYQAEVTVTW